MGGQESLELCGGEDEAAQALGCDDIRDGHLAQQAGDLSEEVPGLPAAAIGPVHPDGGGPFENDVEARSGHTLTQDPLAFAKERLIKGVRDFLELRAGQVGEELEGRDRIDDIISDRHQAGSLAAER